MLSDIDAVKGKGTNEEREEKVWRRGGAALKLARALGKLPILCTYAYNLRCCCIATVGPVHINTDLLAVTFTCTFTATLKAIYVVSTEYCDLSVNRNQILGLS